MLERGFEERKIMNVVNGNHEAFDINIPFVRDAILYNFVLYDTTIF